MDGLHGSVKIVIVSGTIITKIHFVVVSWQNNIALKLKQHPESFITDKPPIQQVALTPLISFFTL
ncbi:MAG TPA: hypothetical protein DCG73_10920 [Morganella sp. (in: Bacteria)]|nr:hypothetical protein [Morganella sp. (in: enterobacteria)]